MSITHIIGYVASVFVGLSLGLTGGGGSILTLPILVYLFGLNPVLSTAYSLFVVGSTSLLGSFQYMKKELVAYHVTLAYGIPSLMSVYLTRRLIVPAIPDPIAELNGMVVAKNTGIMLFFALIMVGAASSMLRNTTRNHTQAPSLEYNLLALQAVMIGVVTGLVGAGGGFLIVPALIIFARLPVKTAIGTSLLIIAINSLLGFLGDLSHQSIDWPFLLVFTALSMAGILTGSYLSDRLSGHTLKKGLGWFILAMGTYIILRELLSNS